MPYSPRFTGLRFAEYVLRFVFGLIGAGVGFGLFFEPNGRPRFFFIVVAGAVPIGATIMFLSCLVEPTGRPRLRFIPGVFLIARGLISTTNGIMQTGAAWFVITVVVGATRDGRFNVWIGMPPWGKHHEYVVVSLPADVNALK